VNPLNPTYFFRVLSTGSKPLCLPLSLPECRLDLFPPGTSPSTPAPGLPQTMYQRHTWELHPFTYPGLPPLCGFTRRSLVWTYPTLLPSEYPSDLDSVISTLLTDLSTKKSPPRFPYKRETLPLLQAITAQHTLPILAVAHGPEITPSFDLPQTNSVSGVETRLPTSRKKITPPSTRFLGLPFPPFPYLRQTKLPPSQRARYSRKKNPSPFEPSP